MYYMRYVMEKRMARKKASHPLELLLQLTMTFLQKVGLYCGWNHDLATRLQ
jgi:hypothetical protein